jgi:fatty acid desaturase
MLLLLLLLITIAITAGLTSAAASEPWLLLLPFFLSAASISASSICGHNISSKAQT